MTKTVVCVLAPWAVSGGERVVLGPGGTHGGWIEGDKDSCVCPGSMGSEWRRESRTGTWR